MLDIRKTVTTALAAVALAVPASALAVATVVTVSDSSLNPGQTVQVTGSCGVENANTNGIVFLFTDDFTAYELVTASGSLDATGTFNSDVTVPASTPAGSYNLVLLCEDDTNVSTPVTVARVGGAADGDGGSVGTTPVTPAAGVATPVAAAAGSGAAGAVGGGSGAQVSAVPVGGVATGGGYLSN